jgi:peroxiredoxin
MAVTPSTMRALGSRAPYFQLPDTAGCQVSLDDFRDQRALLVVFMCNHCPYVKHILSHFLKMVREYQNRGLGVVGISANDVESYPEDGPEHMRRVADELEFPFPYLYDESQQVAKTYGAACTPDFFLFDGERKLVYRGQYDSSRPGNDVPMSGKDLKAAIDAVLAGKPVSTEQRPSLGCNIKWKPGNEPDYFGASH